MKNKIYLTVAILLLPLIFISCSNVPKYEVQGSLKNGYTINVGGVVYSTQPGGWAAGSIWEPNNRHKTTLIGEDKDYSYGKFYSFSEDLRKIFVVERFDKPLFSLFSEGFGDFNFKRTDIQLPSYDLSGIDKFGIANNDSDDYKFINIGEDRQTIEGILALKNTPEALGEYKTKKYCYTIYLMNSNFPGIGIQLPVYLMGEEKYMINMVYDGKYRDISQVLLEQIARQKLPTPSEYIASQQKKAG